MSTIDLDSCINNLRDIPIECRDMCNEINFDANKDWCLLNCDARATDINTPEECIKIVRDRIYNLVIKFGMDPSIVEPLDSIIKRFRTLSSGDTLLPEDVNNINSALRTIRDILAQLEAPTMPTNPCGYSLYDFLKTVCSNGDDNACRWLLIFVIQPDGPPTYYSTDFIAENNITSQFYHRLYSGNNFSEIYIYPHRASNSIGYIDIDDLGLEYEKYVSLTGEEIEEHLSVLAYAYKHGDIGGVGAIVSVRNKYFGDLKRNAPIMRINYGDTGYLIISLTPDKKIHVEHPDGSITIDYNIVEKWMFIVTDFDGRFINLYDENLNNLAYLDYMELSGEGIVSHSRYLYVYKGYYSTSYGSSIFQYDWILIEANALTII